MTLFALVSAGGSPGVTTSALALALGWPSRVIVAECDPSGGDVLAGLFAGHLSGSAGLLPLAMMAGRSAEVAAESLWHQLINLDDERSKLLLAGLSDPRQATAIAPSWPGLAATLASAQADVIADCGRIDAIPATAPLLAAASLAVLVMRPTLRQVSKARQRTELLAGILGTPSRLVVLLVGEGAHSAREVASALDIPVAATLPHDAKTAAVLSDGAGSRRGLAARSLVRAGTVAGKALRDAARAAGPLPAGPPGPPPPAAGQHGADLFSSGQHSNGQHSNSQHSNSQHSTGQYSTGQHGADLFSSGQRGTDPFSTGPFPAGQPGTRSRPPAEFDQIWPPPQEAGTGP